MARRKSIKRGGPCIPPEVQVGGIDAEGLRQCTIPDGADTTNTTNQTQGNTSDLPAPVTGAQALNPNVIASNLIAIAQSTAGVGNQLTSSIQAGLTSPNVANIQATTAIKQQLNQALQGPANVAAQAVNGILAQLAGNMANAPPAFLAGGNVLQAQINDQQAAGGQQLVAPKPAANPKANKQFPDQPTLVRPGNWGQNPKVSAADIQKFDQAGALGQIFSLTGNFGADGTGPTDQWCPLGFTPVEVTEFPNQLQCVKDGFLPGPVQQVADNVPQDNPKPNSVSDSVPPKPADDCIKVCITNLPDQKDKPATVQKYTLWKGKSGCYILKDSDPSKSPSDQKLTTGTPDDSWISIISNTCGQQKQEDKPQDQPSQSGPSQTGVTSCIDDSKILKFSFATDTAGLFANLLNGKSLDQLIKDNQPGVTDYLANPWDSLVKELKLFPLEFLRFIAPVFDAWIQGGPCTDPVMIQEVLSGIGARLIGILTGDTLDYLSVPVEYDKNARCPWIIPSAEAAVSAYLGNTIPLEQLQCIVAANGVRWDQFGPIVEASRTKLSAIDLASLLRRNVINDDEYYKRIREVGYTRDQDPIDILELTKLIPGPQDIVRFMVRDAANQDIVSTFKLDQGFEDNFNGQLKTWADNQGIDETYMRYLWRSHWDIPSPTQLFEMWKRLRHSTEFNPTGDLRADIEKALVQQDIAPYWIDRLLALSYNPLTRTDAKRAYEIGSIDDAELFNSFIDGGYSDENAQRLVDFTKKQLQLKFYRSPYVAKLAAGQMATSEFREAMAFEGAKPDQIDAAYDRAKLLARQKSRASCTAALKKRYFLGEVDDWDLSAKLQQLGVDDEVASMLATGWQCEKQARGKVLPAKTLAKLYREGIIDKNRLFSQLIALGFTADAASDLVAEQDAAITGDKKAKQEKDLAKQIAAQKKAEKEAAAAQKKAEQAGQKEANQEQKVAKALDAAAKAAQAADDKRQAAAAKGLKTIQDQNTKLRNMKLDTATYIAKATGEYLGDVLDEIDAYVRTARAGGIDPMAFAECGLHAAKIFSGTDTTVFFKQWESCWKAPASSN